MAGGRAHYAGPRLPSADPTAAPRVPGDGERWRCAGCGNLTRFDVTRTRRTTDYWHVDLAGVPRVEEETVLAESVESVSCRWCGRSDAIEVVDRADADTAADPSTDPAAGSRTARDRRGRPPRAPSP